MFKFVDLLNSNNVCILPKLLYTLMFLCFSKIGILLLLLPSAICVCKYCKFAAYVYVLLVFIFNKYYQYVDIVGELTLY